MTPEPWAVAAHCRGLHECCSGRAVNIYSVRAHPSVAESIALSRVAAAEVSAEQEAPTRYSNRQHGLNHLWRRASPRSTSHRSDGPTGLGLERSAEFLWGRAAVVGGSLGPRAAADDRQTDGPLINVSPGRHPESLSSVHPLPTSIAAGQRGRGRNATATAVRLARDARWSIWAFLAVGRRPNPCLPDGTHRVAAEQRGVVRCSGSLCSRTNRESARWCPGPCPRPASRSTAPPTAAAGSSWPAAATTTWCCSTSCGQALDGVGSAGLTVKVGRRTPRGTCTPTVKATSGSIADQATTKLTVK